MVFPAAFGFVSSYTPENVEMATDIDKYFNFAITLFFIFGLAFETPVVQMILVKMGVVTIDKMITFTGKLTNLILYSIYILLRRQKV